MRNEAVLIGASVGLGIYLSNRLVEDGWSATVTGRRKLEPGELLQHVRYIQADLTTDAGIQTHLDTLINAPPRLIVFNATLYGAASVVDFREANEIYGVNAIAPYYLISKYIQRVREIESSVRTSCIIINSDSIYHANRYSGHYAASKAALRVLTSSLADLCFGTSITVSTLHLGPIGDEKKKTEIRKIAKLKNTTEKKVTEVFLKRSNPSFVIEDLIDMGDCYKTLAAMVSLGLSSNGMHCKLDGGSSGSFN